MRLPDKAHLGFPKSAQIPEIPELRATQELVVSKLTTLNRFKAPVLDGTNKATVWPFAELIAVFVKTL